MRGRESSRKFRFEGKREISNFEPSTKFRFEGKFEFWAAKATRMETLQSNLSRPQNPTVARKPMSTHAVGLARSREVAATDRMSIHFFFSSQSRRRRRRRRWSLLLPPTAAPGDLNSPLLRPSTRPTAGNQRWCRDGRHRRICKGRRPLPPQSIPRFRLPHAPAAADLLLGSCCTPPRPRRCTRGSSCCCPSPAERPSPGRPDPPPNHQPPNADTKIPFPPLRPPTTGALKGRRRTRTSILPLHKRPSSSAAQRSLFFPSAPATFSSCRVTFSSLDNVPLPDFAAKWPRNDRAGRCLLGSCLNLPAAVLVSRHARESKDFFVPLATRCLPLLAVFYSTNALGVERTYIHTCLPCQDVAFAAYHPRVFVFVCAIWASLVLHATVSQLFVVTKFNLCFSLTCTSVSRMIHKLMGSVRADAGPQAKGLHKLST